MTTADSSQTSRTFSYHVHSVTSYLFNTPTFNMTTKATACDRRATYTYQTSNYIMNDLGPVMNVTVTCDSYDDIAGGKITSYTLYGDGKVQTHIWNVQLNRTNAIRHTVSFCNIKSLFMWRRPTFASVRTTPIIIATGSSNAHGHVSVCFHKPWL